MLKFISKTRRAVWRLSLTCFVLERSTLSFVILQSWYIVLFGFFLLSVVLMCSQDTQHFVDLHYYVGLLRMQRTMRVVSCVYVCVCVILHVCSPPAVSITVPFPLDNFVSFSFVFWVWSVCSYSCKEMFNNLSIHFWTVGLFLWWPLEIYQAERYR